MSAAAVAGVAARPFGVARDGRAVTCWTLAAEGIELEVLDHGAIVRVLRVPDRHGTMGDVVLGHDTLAAYEADPFHLGAMIGRVAGRIRDAAFTLDGERHVLAANAGTAHLHGGVRGFGARAWEARPVPHPGGAALELRRTSPDGEEGYPGTVEVVLTYAVVRDRFEVTWTATTDRATPVNLTQHAYFDLSAGACADVRGHVVQVHASRRLVLDAALLPTGEIADVTGTPFDLRQGTVLGERLDDPHPPLRAARGFDLTYLLDAADAPAAVVTEPVSGRTMTVHTTEPALQLYSGNYLDEAPQAHVGRRFARHAGLCLETQHCPDAPNQPHFASVIVRPGEVRRSRTTFTFGRLP